MDQPKKSKSRYIYDAISKEYELGTFEEFEKALQDPNQRKAFYDGVGAEYDLGAYKDFERNVLKKKVSPSPVPKPKLASPSAAGSLGLPENQGIFLDKLPTQKAKPTAPKAPEQTSSTDFKEGGMAWTHQKLLEADPHYDDLYDRYLEAKKLPEGKEKEIRQEVEDEANNVGFMNKLRTGAATLTSMMPSWLGGTSGKDIDPLYKEKEKAKKELQVKDKKGNIIEPSEEAITQRAKEMRVSDRLKSESDSQVRDLLKNLQETNIGLGNANARQQLAMFQTGNYKTLEEKDKLNLEKQNIIRGKVDNSVSRLTALNKEVAEHMKQGEAVPNELKQQYESEAQAYRSVLSDAIATQEEFVNNREKLGDAAENLDVFKRDYSWGRNFLGNLESSAYDISAGLDNFVDYMAQGNPAMKPLGIMSRQSAKNTQKLAEDTRSEIMKPIAVDDINSMEDFGSWLSNTVIGQQVPIYALIATGAPGVAAIGASSTGQKYGEMRDEMEAGTANYSDAQLAGIPLAFGATETASAMVDRYLLKNAGRVIRSAAEPERKLIANGMWNTIKDSIGKLPNASLEVGKGALTEAADEAGTQLTQNLIDIYAGDKDSVGIWDNVKDAGAAGAVMGALIPFGGAVASVAVKPFTTDNQIQESSAEIMRLRKELENPELSDNARQIVENQLTLSESKLEKQLRKTVGSMEKLTNEQFQNILKVEDTQAKLKQSARELNRDNTIDPDTKKMLLNNLHAEFNTAEQTRLSILNNEAQQETTQPEAQPQAEKQTQVTEVTQDNESIQEGDTIADGDVRPGAEGMGTAPITTESLAQTEDLQSATDTGTGERAAAREYRLGTGVNAKPYTVSLTDGRLDIKDTNGNEPSAPTRRKIEDQYANDVDFTTGDLAPETEQADINPAQYIADTSSNPVEVARALTDIDTDSLINENISYKDRVIAENLGNVSRSSFIENSDANNIGMSLAKSYLRNEGRPLDTIAQEMSEISGIEISEQDIVDFMLENPNGPQSLINKVKREATEPLKRKFTELTGLPANEKYLQKAIEQQNIKDNFATSLDYLSDEELAALAYEQSTINEENEGQEKTTITRTEGRDESQDTGQDEGRSGIQGESGESRGNRQSEAGDPGINSTEQASIQDRKSGLVTERIKPEKRAPKNPPRKLNQILADLTKGLKSTVIYGRSGRARSLGTYNPSNALVRITRAGDIDTAAHEIGHLLDDRFNLLDTIPSASRLQALNELKWFFDRGGSNPPAKLNTEQKAKYLEREGLGEFIRAYIANPTQTKTIALTLTEHFENSLDDKTLEVIHKFSDDYLDFANASYGDQILSNVEDSSLPNKKGFKEWREKFRKEDGRFNVTPFDNLNAHLLNSMGIANKAFKFLTTASGKDNLMPDENFEIMSRLFAGVNGKTNRMLSTGLRDAKNNLLTDKDGNAMNVEWLLEPLDNSSEKTVKEDMDDVIKLLVAERTMEYARKFGRLDNLTGIGAGIDSDIDVAQGYLNEFEQLKETNKEKYDRIKFAAKRYRDFADAGLKYAVQKGRISKDSYQQIKDNNQYYAALARVNENAPMEDEVPFFNENAGGLASVKDIIKKAKGGTKFIQNPYASLLQNTVNIIKESDRNEVLASFIEPMQQIREMGDGTPTDFSQIARPAHTGDKNTKTIFVDGEAQRWQFAQDIYDSLTSLEAAAKSPLVDFMSKPAQLIRFTVTNFPTFALRNAVRDTTSRMIVSRTNSGLKDLIHNAKDKELFELYGGSQAGFYLTDKDAYQQKMKETVKEITNSGGIVLDPRYLYRNYRKILEKGENLNRIAEFKSAYRKAKKEGLDDYNAGLYAAYQARDLMDFSVAGHTIRSLNRFIPFLNAGIQGLRRTGRAAKENPAGFAARTALYTVLPTILFRQLVSAMGDDEEYEQLPAYQRDLFWMFKTPMTGDAWIAIPKPFEQGLVSSAVDRGISQMKGSETPWEGFGGTLAKSAMPFDDSSLLGGLKPIFEAGVNYNMFTDRPIVPAWEEGKLMELRGGAEKASRVGKGLHKAFNEAGLEVDPRKIDHVLTGYGTYMADWGLSFGDLGVEKSRFKFGPSKTGFAKDVPLNNSVSVNAVYKLATELGAWQRKDIKALRGKIEKYYEEEDAAKRKDLSKEIYADAKEIRAELEKKKVKVKEKATE